MFNLFSKKCPTNWDWEHILIKSESLAHSGGALLFLHLLHMLFCLFLILMSSFQRHRDSSSLFTRVLSGWEGSGPGRTWLRSPPPHLLFPHLQVSNTWFLKLARSSGGVSKWGPARVSTAGFREGITAWILFYLSTVYLFNLCPR